MNDNVYPNPDPNFPCSVYVGNVTWKCRSMQCCTCSKCIHLRCLLLSFSRFNTLRSFYYWSCPPCFASGSSGDSTPTNAVTSPLGSSTLYASTVQSGPSDLPFPMHRSHPTLAYKPSTLLPPTLCLITYHPIYPLMLRTVLLFLLLPLLP